MVRTVGGSLYFRPKLSGMSRTVALIIAVAVVVIAVVLVVTNVDFSEDNDRHDGARPVSVA